jgi:hypothetical protein
MNRVTALCLDIANGGVFDQNRPRMICLALLLGEPDTDDMDSMMARNGGHLVNCARSLYPGGWSRRGTGRVVQACS